MLELALIENIQREDINAIDAAVAFRRLIDEFGLTQEDVAARVGKSRPAVANTLRLLNLPPGIRQKVASGELSEGHARALLGLESAPDAQQALVNRILTQHLNVRETEKLVREITDRKRSPDTPPTPQRDPYLTKIEEHLQRYFGTRVSIARSGDRGTIRIDFYDQDQFERILELLTTT
jgi:ParB family chromosome partitioning protein